MKTNETKNNFSEDNKSYKTRDPYKVALLLCLGAKIDKVDDSDKNNITFLLKADNIVELVDMIHSGEPSDLTEYGKHIKDVFGIIRDIKLNRTVTLGGVK